MVELLLDNEADIDAQSEDGNTPVHLAAEQGHKKSVKFLLSRRVNTKTTNLQGATALHAAAGTVNDEAVVPVNQESD